MRKNNINYNRRNNNAKSNSPLIGQEFAGKIDIVKSGSGFLMAEGLEQDVMVRPEHLKSALKGDTVKVKIYNVSDRNNRPEGEVIQVINHLQNEFSGKLEVKKTFAFLIPDNANMRFDIFVPIKDLGGAQNGDRVVVQITEWDTASKKPSGKVVEILTAERENEVAMKAILLENGFPIRFPEDVIHESESLPNELDKEEIAKRLDLRNTLTFTIDPLDAKDFDDAISFKRISNGIYEVGVHIADVSHYVQPGTALDDEAYKRATSVYLPDRVSPMLPERISNELCSLRPNEDKFTFSAIFRMNKFGNIKKTWIGRTVIHSDRRFTYEEAQTVIETGQGDYAKEITLLHGISQSLRKERFEKGAINFSSQEVRFVLDEKGIPTGITIKESKESNQLIEELMLLANKAVATYVHGMSVNGDPVPFPYRTHDMPNEEKLASFASFITRFGYHIDLSDPDKLAASFNKMLQDVHGKPEEHVIAQLGVRTMAKAEYTPNNVGHYGLGFENYCHFTSPIRRYPDVMVHRIIQQCLDNQIVPDKLMDQECAHCSERERKAMESERSANKYKQVEFMSQFVGDRFEALVSGVATFGFWAETIEQKCEGLIPIIDLAAIDDFTFVEEEYALIGQRTKKRFRIGDKVTIQVLSANQEKRQLDFGFVDENGKLAEPLPLAKNVVNNQPRIKVASKANEITPPKQESAKPIVQEPVVATKINTAPALTQKNNQQPAAHAQKEKQNQVQQPTKANIQKQAIVKQPAEDTNALAFTEQQLQLIGFIVEKAVTKALETFDHKRKSEKVKKLKVEKKKSKKKPLF